MGKLLARESPSQGLVDRRGPPPHQGGSFEWPAKPELREPIKGLAIIGICRENELRQVTAAKRTTLEKIGIVPLHVAQVAEQCIGKVFAAGEAAKPRKIFKPRSIARHRMGLLVRNHLQAVLDLSQEPVGGAEIGVRLGIDPTAAMQRIERGQRRSRAQLGMTSSCDELLCLDEELDLADAAAAKLDVV